MANKTREAAYKKKRDLWKELIFDTRGPDTEAMAAQRLALLETWRTDPWAWLTGRDIPTEEDRDRWPDGKPIIWTVDEADDEAPVKPFPGHKLYLRDMVKEMMSYRFVFVDKTRQMYVTTLAGLLIDHYCAFNDEREVLVSRVKEEHAEKLINDKIRTPHTRKPAWLQAAIPVDKAPKNIITYQETGSTVTAVSQNFANTDARGVTASLILIDEAAFQDQFAAIYRAVVPMATRLWAVSTANIGNPGAERFKELIFDGRPGHEDGQVAA